MSSASRGRFLVVDGPDGAGKSTQVQLLAEQLQRAGRNTLLLREPGGTSLGEAVRGLVLEHRKINLSPLTEAFLFQAARAQLMDEVVRPAIEAGKWVICDRFTLSTLVYQGYAGGVKKKTVKRLSTIATGGMRPDLYLVLWVPPEIGVERRTARAADRMESKGEKFIRDVAAAFQKEAKRLPERYRLIDGRGSVEEVRARMWEPVEAMLK